MEKPILKKEDVEKLIETRFINVVEMNYDCVKHYYNVSRHKPERIAALLSDEEFRALLPDAVTSIVIVKTRGEEPRLLLTKEFRYPCGQFLLSPPAGLMDPSDREEAVPQIATAVREIREETGLTVKPSDKVFIVNPLAFSSPGMTDESNGLVCAVIEADPSEINSEGTESAERIGDYQLLTRAEARRVLKQGRDDQGIFYSVYTWMALIYFVSGLWEDEL